MSPTALNPSARTSDPITSKVSAPDTSKKMTNRERILAAFKKRPKRGFTSEEVAIATDLFKPGICYWKRVSELEDLGMIKVLMHDGAPVTRLSSKGRPQQVYVVSSSI